MIDKCSLRVTKVIPRISVSAVTYPEIFWEYRGDFRVGGQKNIILIFEESFSVIV